MALRRQWRRAGTSQGSWWRSEVGKGARMGEQDKFGVTALMIASHNGHKEVAALLLGKGASTGGRCKRRMAGRS